MRARCAGGSLSATLAHAAALALLVGHAHAQLAVAPPGVAADCSDINALYATVRNLGAECCPPGLGTAGCEPGGPPTACSARCGAAAVTLIDRCESVLLKTLPANVFAALRGLYDRCIVGLTSVSPNVLSCTYLRLPRSLSLTPVPPPVRSSLAPQADALAELKQRVGDGVCSAAALEGVGATAVPAALCEDTYPRCAAGIAAGFLTCKTDFCSACSTMPGQCDSSCGFCGRRRLQAGGTCPIATFSSESAGVTGACCDAGTGGCADDGSPPAECDARCGIVFIDFFTDCGGGLRAFMPDTYHDFERLEQTCAQVRKKELSVVSADLLVLFSLLRRRSLKPYWQV